MEFNAFRPHLGHAPVDQALLHLEVGDAVAEQAADARVLLEHRHVVPGPRQLLGAREAGGAGADHRDSLEGAVAGNVGLDPALGPGAIDDRAFDRLDGDRDVADVEGAGGLARRRTDAAGELGKVVGRVQHLVRLAPVAAIDQIVPVRDDVVDRATLVAVRHAAIHAARALALELVLGQRLDELAVVLETLRDRRGVALMPLDLQESGRLAHERRSYSAAAVLAASSERMARRARR